MAPLIDITSDAQFESEITQIPPESTAIIFFHAPWATPCVQVREILSTVAATHQANEKNAPKFFSVNADDLPDICEKYNVTAVPFIAIEKDHKVVDSVSGNDGNKIRSALERHGSTTSKPAFQLPPQQVVSASAAPPSKPASDRAQTSKDLSSYAPKPDDPQTAPQFSGGETTKETKDELWKRLSELVKAAPVMLFMKGVPSAPQCGFSRTLVNLLRERGVRYGFFNILADEDVRQGLKEFADWPTFPQLWVDGELVGGLDIVKEELASDPEFFAKHTAGTGAGGPAPPPGNVSAAA